jgi:hypothetical protein
MNGWGGRIRTYECQIQNLVTYRLSTPQSAIKTLRKRGCNLIGLSLLIKCKETFKGLGRA